MTDFDTPWEKKWLEISQGLMTSEDKTYEMEVEIRDILYFKDLMEKNYPGFKSICQQFFRNVMALSQCFKKVYNPYFQKIGN